MHIDKKSGEFNEENYISCILDDDNTEIPPAASTKTPSPENLENQHKTNVIIKPSRLSKSPIEEAAALRNGTAEDHHVVVNTK